jgi:glycosyltransferase involved in cell wall biosynthesis
VKIAVLVPCYNEELTVGKVVKDFRQALPEAEIYVYDNNSSDGTFDAAVEAGAIVRREVRQGKGNVVRSMFRQIEADYYIMVDGDDTYPASYAEDLLKPVMEGEADMVVGARLSRFGDRSFRKFHLLGNRFIVGLINILFNSRIQDALSGYRSFTRLFVKTMPVVSSGFEIETEMTTHALDRGFILREVPIDYGERPQGSESKLSTFRDGVLIVKTIFRIFKDYKPFVFFTTLSVLLLIAGLGFGIPVVLEFLRTGLVLRFPTAILASALVTLSVLLFSVGLILDTTVRHQRENYELWVKNFHD